MWQWLKLHISVVQLPALGLFNKIREAFHSKEGSKSLVLRFWRAFFLKDQMWQAIAAGETKGAAPNDAGVVMPSTSGECGHRTVWVA